MHLKNRLWWTLYIQDQIGCAEGGRFVYIRDDEFSVKDPSDHWIPELIGEEASDPSYETEATISRRLLWTVKLMRIVGNILGTMHSIKAETSSRRLAMLSKTQVPQLHNRLTSWYMDLPNELAFDAYASPPPSQLSTSSTGLLHMLYYLNFITLHVPYVRVMTNHAGRTTASTTNSSVCTASANNIGYIFESLMLYGHLKGPSAYMATSLLSPGFLYVYYATIQTAEAQRTALAGLCRLTRVSLEFMKIYPSAEMIMSTALDAYADVSIQEQESTLVSGKTPGSVEPLTTLLQSNTASLKHVYNASRKAKSSLDGSGPTPSLQLRHPSLSISVPLGDEGVHHN